MCDKQLAAAQYNKAMPHVNRTAKMPCTLVYNHISDRDSLFFSGKEESVFPVIITSLRSILSAVLVTPRFTFELLVKGVRSS